MKRNAKDLPEGHRPPGGIPIMRNPGVAAVLVTRNYKLFKDDNASSGFLITMGEPERVEWYAQRRAATRDEVMASIESGLGLLKAEADKDPEPVVANKELGRLLARTLLWVPS
jgi:hypothetical protein